MEGLLLENVSVVGSPLLRDLAKGLYEGRQALWFESEGAALQDHLTIEQLLILFYSEVFITPAQTTSLEGLLRPQGVATLRDFRDGEVWRTVASFRRSTRETRQGENVGLVWMLDQIQSLAQP